MDSSNKFFTKVFTALLFIFISSVISPEAQAETIITNIANASFTINGIPQTQSDSVEFTTDTVINPTGISLGKVADKTTALHESTITYTLSISNNENLIQNNLSIQDTLPIGLEYVVGTAKLNGSNLGSGQVTVTGNQLTFDLGNLAANATSTITYDVLVTALAPLGTAINQVIANSDTASSTPAQANVEIIEIPPPTIVPLVLQKSASTTTAKVGETIIYTLAINNPNDSTISNVFLEDILPQGLVYNSGTAKFNNNSINPVSINSLSFNLGDMPPNSSWTLSYETIVEANISSRSLSNQASLIADDPKAFSEISQVTVQILDDTILINKSVDKTTVDIGEIVTYTVTLSSTAKHDLNNLTIIDNLPTGFIYQANSAQINGQAVSPSDIVVSGSNLQININNFPQNSNLTLTYQALVSEQVINGNAVNQVQASSDFANSNLATATVNVLEVSIPLQLDKQVNVTSAKVGETVKFTLQINNPNNKVLLGIKVEDLLPQGMVFKTGSAKFNNNTISPVSTDTLTFDLGSIAANASWTLSYETIIEGNINSQSLTNQASVIADDPKANSNTSQASVEILNDIVSISKTVDKQKVEIGGVVNYTVTLNNSTQHELNNIVVLDTLPTGFIYQNNSAEVNGQAVSATDIVTSGSVLQINIATLAQSQNLLIRYQVKVSEQANPGDAINQVQASSDHTNTGIATATVKVRTPSIIDFLKIDDNGVVSVIPQTAFDNSQNGGKTWEEINSIKLPNGTVINLPTPQPIVDADEYSLSDPVVIQVRDLDQNLDPEKLETIFVTVEIPGTRDTEVLLLTETSPDSGIFRGIVLTTTDPTQTHNGLLTIKDGSKINVTYRDQEDSSDSSATAALVVPDTKLVLNKTADKYDASIGELVRYTLEFTNTTSFNLATASIGDLLPIGFRYVTATTKLNGNSNNSITQSNGRSLKFNLTNIPSGSSLTIEYLTKITAGVQIGDAVNKAQLTSGSLVSNQARATVVVKDDLMRNTNLLTGRVYIGCRTKTEDNKKPEMLYNARIYLETGRSVLSDEEGFWHMEGVTPGTHVLQLDADSLPKGYEPLLCEDNTRHAGDAKSQFVHLQAGSLWHVDFHVKINPDKVKEIVKQKITKKKYKVNPVELYGDKYLKNAPTGLEILWPKNNFVPDVASTKILVKSSPKHKIEVYLNGKEVSALNYDGSDTNKARTVTIRRWLGVDIDVKRRNNTLLVIAKDKSGKEVGRKTHNIHFSGDAAYAKILAEESILIADGKTNPVIALQIKDEDGFPMRANTHGYLTLENSNYQVRTLEDNDNERLNLNESIAGSHKYLIEEDGIARVVLNPTTQSGEVKFTIKFSETRSKTFSVWLKPKLRKWIMVGIAEGTLAHKTLSGNMQTLRDLDKSDEFFKRGRIAFFAKGQVKGKYLLTIAYDTHKKRGEVGSQLEGNIDPDAWYTIYADNSNSQYEAPSSRKLYLKIEKDNFYALFGDFHTGLTVTELASYERVLNGIQTEYRGERFSFKGFISETSDNHHHEEIPGDGTSGLYHLANNIIPNSESIRIETRDRFHSDRILESRQLSRYQDYNIDYDAGTLFFKFPITGRDNNLNPNIIVVDYDSEDDSNKSIAAGGRLAMKSLDGRMETGLSFIHEGRNKNKDDTLVAADITYNITTDTKVHAEIAQSKTQESDFKNRQAVMIELEKEIEKMEARLYYKKQDEDFGISSQASEVGTEKMGAEVNYRLNEKTRLNSQLSHQKNLNNDNSRDLAEIGVEHRFNQIEVNAGLRHTREEFNDSTSGSDKINSNVAVLGGSYTTDNDKVTFRGDLEKNLSSKSGSEISPDRIIVGVDVKLKQGFSVFAEHETTDNGDIRTYNNRVGVSKDLWKGAKGKTTYTQERTDEGQRNYATLGLSQKLKLTEKISADFSVDQAKTISGNNTPNTFNENEPAIQGTQRDDYTAFSVGLGSNQEKWSWTTRAEYRNGEIEDKINFLASVIRKLDDGKSLSAKLSYYNTENKNGYTDETIKLSFGTAWHPSENDFVVFSRLDLIDEISNNQQTGNNFFDDNSNTKKIIHNVHYNRKLNKKTQFGIHHGIKHVKDENGDTRVSTTVDTATVEIRHDINKKWDIGVHAGYLHDWDEKTLETVAGVSVGVTPAKNAWVELGYNFEGFTDEDFDGYNHKRKGPYVDFRYKFNQDSLDGKDLPVRKKQEPDETVQKPEKPKKKGKKVTIDSLFELNESRMSELTSADNQ